MLEIALRTTLVIYALVHVLKYVIASDGSQRSPIPNATIRSDEMGGVDERSPLEQIVEQNMCRPSPQLVCSFSTFAPSPQLACVFIIIVSFSLVYCINECYYCRCYIMNGVIQRIGTNINR